VAAINGISSSNSSDIHKWMDNSSTGTRGTRCNNKQRLVQWSDYNRL
jgi:hypothetical protein